MRVITGSARGCRLETLAGEETRPTTERVKEGLFSAIQFDIEGRRVLDLFAGWGQLGIEALSRGAAGCVFVDNQAAACEVIRRNLRTTGLSAAAQVLTLDAGAYLARPGERFDLVFLDPPYRSDLLDRLLPRVADCLSPGGILLCETDGDRELPAQVGAFRQERVYRYGRIRVWLYRWADETGGETA